MTGTDRTVYCTAFLGERVVASGGLDKVVTAVKTTIDDPQVSQVLIFDDSTSEQLEIDFRGTTDSVLNRLAKPEASLQTLAGVLSPRPVGRPKLGVVAGEVTLLPRHWEWLKSQPGGASVTLRKLVDEARRVREKQYGIRAAQEATYRFMAAMAGNYAHYEEALRALYARDGSCFEELIQSWAPDVRDHIRRLAAKAFFTEEGAYKPRLDTP